MKRETRIEQILDAACELFADQGYNTTSISQIAARCECSPALIMRYFSSKESLFERLLEEYETACKAPIITETPSGTVMEKLEDIYSRLTSAQPFPWNTRNGLQAAVQTNSSYRDRVQRAMAGTQDVGMDVLYPLLHEGVEANLFPPDFPAKKTARLLWLYIIGVQNFRENYPQTPIIPFSTIKEFLFIYE